MHAFVRTVLCATLALAAASADAAHAPHARHRAAASAETDALAISWEPAFCLTVSGKPECESETAGRHDAHAFSLHGLWPQSGSYCGATPAQQAADKAGQWSTLPEVTLQPDTQATLEIDEPGMQSHLERHEWIEHGTCSGLSQQVFFATSLAMLDGIDAGKLGTLVGANVGGQLTLAQLQAAAALDYGSGARAGIEYLCIAAGGKAYLEEVRFHMRLPSPLPSAVTGALLTRPLRPAASTQLCKSNTPIAVRAVAN